MPEKAIRVNLLPSLADSSIPFAFCTQRLRRLIFTSCLRLPDFRMSAAAQPVSGSSNAPNPAKPDPPEMKEVLKGERIMLASKQFDDLTAAALKADIEVGAFSCCQ